MQNRRIFFDTMCCICEISLHVNSWGLLWLRSIHTNDTSLCILNFVVSLSLRSVFILFFFAVLSFDLPFFSEIYADVKCNVSHLVALMSGLLHASTPSKVYRYPIERLPRLPYFFLIRTTHFTVDEFILLLMNVSRVSDVENFKILSLVYHLFIYHLFFIIIILYLLIW